MTKFTLRLLIVTFWLICVILPFTTLFYAPLTPPRIELVTAWRMSMAGLMTCGGLYIAPTLIKWIKKG